MTIKVSFSLRPPTLALILSAIGSVGLFVRARTSTDWFMAGLVCGMTFVCILVRIWPDKP